MIAWIYLLTLVLAAVFILKEGDGEVRAAFWTLLFAYSGTMIVVADEGHSFWISGQWTTALVDLSAFVTLLVLALKSNRFWPLPIASLQLLPVLTPIVATYGQGLKPYGVGISQGIWSYFQIVILVLAAVRTKKRRERV